MPSAFTHTGQGVLSALRIGDCRADLSKRSCGLLLLPDVKTKLTEASLIGECESF